MNALISTIMHAWPYIKIPIAIMFPTFVNISVHYICEYIYCNEWYSLNGLSLHCNACIDIKKILNRIYL